MEELKIVNAYCSVEVHCKCPYCDSFEDVFEDVRNDMHDDHTANNIEVLVKCTECGQEFIVDNVLY